MDHYHIPVLEKEAVDMLGITAEGRYADLTFGGGGHSREILSRLGPEGRLYGFDQDRDALANAPDDPRFTMIQGNFRFMRSYLRLHGAGQLNGVLADLGVSSHHFDTPERGFSFRSDAPLDMRMNQRGRLSAREVINSYSQEKLTAILGLYGEISTPYKVASCIDRARRTTAIETVSQLIDAVAPCTPKNDGKKFLSKLFQAIRIEVNAEIDALQMALEQSLRVLAPGGRLVIISYHSLEDRLVKNFFRSGNLKGDIATDFFGNRSVPFEVITRKAIVPSAQEQQHNPRSRSAKMRVAQKK